jgi:hypothetical protein
MNPRELVDHIRSGPAELVLDEPLRFRRRTRSNPCDFNEFLQALHSSETIRFVRCGSQLNLGITEEEWVLLVKTLGRIRYIHMLTLWCSAGSRDFHPFQAVADAVNNARLLRKLVIAILEDDTFPRDPPGLTALANTLREHTALQRFGWVDGAPRLEAAHELTDDLDPVLRALPACPHAKSVQIMTRNASADATKNLLQLPTNTALTLALTPDHWLAVADGIRQGRCNVQRLTLSMVQGTRPEATKAVQALAMAIQLDCNLLHLSLEMENWLTDEAAVALAEALTVNKALCMFTLFEATFGTQAYEAFSAMLRVNTSLALKLPPFETDGADERLLESRNQMVIEQRLNQVGRGRLLASRQTTREKYADALNELNSCNFGDSPAFQVSCLYSLLRLHPAVCMS